MCTYIIFSMDYCLQIKPFNQSINQSIETKVLAKVDDLKCTDDPFAGAWVINKVSGHQHRWLAGGYDLEIGHF